MLQMQSRKRGLRAEVQSEAFQEIRALAVLRSTAEARVFFHTQGARCSGLGSVAVPAPAAAHQRQTRPDGFARR